MVCIGKVSWCDYIWSVFKSWSVDWYSVREVSWRSVHILNYIYIVKLLAKVFIVIDKLVLILIPMEPSCSTDIILVVIDNNVRVVFGKL